MVSVVEKTDFSIFQNQNNFLKEGVVNVETKSKSVIRKLGQMLRNKEISCEEITKKYLESINKNSLNAYVKVCEEKALDTSKKVDEKIKKGENLNVLEGLPMTLKDVISTKGIETTCCSKILKGYTPIYSATVWENLENKNAVLLGKTNMDEFAMGSTCETSAFGGAKNPHNEKYVSGGSSGGAASAVAGNIAVYGLGSDTGGSVRQPASFCGVVGLKPTYGCVSRYGLIAYASSFDQIGPIAKTVEDAAIVFDEISGYDPKDSTSNPKGVQKTAESLNKNIKGLKLGIPKQYFESSGLDPEVKNALEKAMKTYQSLGAEIEYFDFPEAAVALSVYYVLVCAEASSNLARFDGVRYGFRADSYRDINEMMCKTRSEGFGEEVKRRILLGNYVLSSGYYDAYYSKAQKLREVIRGGFNSAFEKFDAILTPTSPTPALAMGKTYATPDEMYLADIYTAPINVAGLPAISVPCEFSSEENLPIGMQIIGNKFSEAKILNIAHQFEVYTDYAYNKDLDMGVRI